MGNQQRPINISAPNLMNVCVDGSGSGEMSGRLYHCYDRNPQRFDNVMQLLNMMESLFDSIGYPQASTKTRYFIEPEKKAYEEQGYKKPEKVAEQKELLSYTGEKGTFIIHVKYRQNSAWQGEIVWMERNIWQQFSSTLEFIKLMDNALGTLN